MFGFGLDIMRNQTQNQLMQPLQTVQPPQPGQSDQPAGPSEASPFMTVEQAAEILHVSPEHVRRAISAGRIPGFRFGRAYRVWRSFVERVLAEMEAGRFVDFDDFAAAQMTGEVAS